LDLLTGIPSDGDAIQFIIPVVGPYSALRKYKYHTKLVPGTNTRGEATKQCISCMIFNAKSSEEDISLIKKLTDNEMVACLLGDVKVMLPEELKELNLLKFKEKVNKKKIKKGRDFIKRRKRY